MNKKITKPSEQTDKKYEDRHVREREECNRKIRGRVMKLDIARLHNLNRGQKVLHDRGDSKNPKNEDSQLKCDGGKNKRSVEVNFKSNRNVTNSNSGVDKSGVPTKKLNEIQKENSNNRNVSSENAKKKLLISWTPMDRKAAEDRRHCGKEEHSQKILGKNDPACKTKVGDQKKTKIKEVITIPYIPAEDSAARTVDDDPTEHTRPIIKTVTSNPKTVNARAAKTVTFKDQRVKMNVHSNTERRFAKPRPSLASFKSQTIYSRTRTPNAKQINRRRKNFSPSPDKYDINEFPPTEVVKWEPSCLTSETLPYYEAWIDTTLTAFSKCTDEEKLLLEKDLIEAFQCMKRPVSPELAYERSNDERYTGKIKVKRHRK